MSILEQLANIASEVNRTVLAAGDAEKQKEAFRRAIELFYLTLSDSRWRDSVNLIQEEVVRARRAQRQNLPCKRKLGYVKVWQTNNAQGFMKKCKPHQFLQSAAIGSLICLSMHANIAICNPPTTPALFLSNSNPFDSLIRDFIIPAEFGDYQTCLFQLQNVAQLLYQSDDIVLGSCAFLQNLVDHMNRIHGTSFTLSDILQITKAYLPMFDFSEAETQKLVLGLDVINCYQSDYAFANSSNFIQLASHREKKSKGFWDWVAVATVSTCAIVLCVFYPEAVEQIAKGLSEAIVQSILSK